MLSWLRIIENTLYLTFISFSILLVILNTNQPRKGERFDAPEQLFEYNKVKPDCYVYKENYTNVEAVLLEDILLTSAKPTPGRTIFFLETRCHWAESVGIFNLSVENEVNLNARQACAVEAAALHNPSYGIYVLFASPVVWPHGYRLRPIMQELLSYENVHLNNVNMKTFALNSPFSQWLENGKLFRSQYAITHISDFLRYLTLWRYGGTYMDLDAITLRSMEDLNNFSGAESNITIAAGVMNFSPSGLGRQIAKNCLIDFKRSFNGNIWSTNGPGVITRVMKRLCNSLDVTDMYNPKNCRGFHVFNPEAFYAVPYDCLHFFFETEFYQRTLDMLNNSYVAHLWNKETSKRRTRKGAKVALNQIMMKNCPKVYKAIEDYF